MIHLRKLRTIHVVVGAWVLLLFCFMYALGAYEQTPGEESDLQQWPADFQRPSNNRERTLVFFAHPGCPCTKPSVEQLRSILPQDGTTEVLVFLFKPATEDARWTHTELFEKLSQIPGARIESDSDGKIAEKFHVRTSGTTLIFDKGGKVLFSGGLTRGRGTEGDNDNAASARSVLAGSTVTRTLQKAVVYGCSFFIRERQTRPPGGVF
ncbi:MAG: hypothetical protein K8S54_14065 [Spirochaetia bacterium]|nr:hypothetical protein [Spirochaetia bacterium]